MELDFLTRTVAQNKPHRFAGRAVEAIFVVVVALVGGPFGRWAAGEVPGNSVASYRLGLHLDRLSSDDAGVRRRAMCALVRIGPPALEELLRKLVDAELSEPFVKGLSAFKERAVPALLTLLGGPDTAVRDRAVRVLGEIGFPAAEAATALSQFLDPGNETLCVLADNALSKMGCAALPAILPVLDSEDPKRRELAAELIERAFHFDHESVDWETESANKEKTSDIAIDALISRLKIENNTTVRCCLIEALATIGERHHADLISQALAGVLHDPAAEVRACAVNAFGQIQIVPNGSPLVLHSALDDPSAEVRASAADAIGLLANQLVNQAPCFIEALSLKLSDGNASVRKNATVALGRFGSHASEAVDSIIEAIRAGRSDIDGIEALGSIGPGAASAVTTLSEMLDGRNLAKQDDKLVAPIVVALGRIGPAAKTAGSSLTRVLKFGKEYWQDLAIDASGEVQLAETVPLLVALWPRPLATKDRVVEALFKIGTPSIIYLDDAANATDMSARQRALKLLTLLSPASLPVMLARLNSEDPQTCRSMVLMIGESSIQTPEIAAPFIRALGDDPIARIAKAKLVAIGEPATKSLGRALLAGGSTSAQVAEVLMNIGPSAVPVLIEALDSDNPLVIQNAAMALGGLGPQAKAAKPKLTELLAKDAARDARPTLISTLGKILARTSPPPSLFRKLTENDRDARPDGIVKFFDLGFDPEHFRFIGNSILNISVRTSNDVRRTVGVPKSQTERMQAALGFAPQGGERFAPDRHITRAEPIPAILKALTDEDVNVRRTAVFALIEMAPNLPEVVKGLIQSLNDKDVMVRRGAASALGAIRTTDREAVLALADALLDDDQQQEVLSGQGGGVGARAAAALADIGPPAAPAVSALIQIIERGIRGSQHNTDTLGNSALALGRIGPSAAEAAPALRRLLERRLTSSDGNSADVYHNAALAIGKIGVDPSESIPVLIKALGDSDESVQWAAAEALATLAEDHQDRMETSSVDLLKNALTALDHTAFEPQKQIMQRAVSFLKLTAERNKLTDMLLSFLKIFGMLILGHLLFWVLFLAGYQRWRWVQMIVLSNPWSRRILSFGYVQAILVGVGPVRRWLFRPLRDRLTSDIRMEFAEEYLRGAYYAGLELASIGSVDDGDSQPASKVIGPLQGRFIIEGAAGRGKTTLLTHVVLSHPSRIIVFVSPETAERFKGDVLAMIQARLEGLAEDKSFLRQLIRNDSVDFVFDGLNEMSVGTRDELCKFVEDVAPANVIMSTQPMQWNYPSNARIMELLPLNDGAIREFLHVQVKALEPADTDTYDRACREFVERSLRVQGPTRDGFAREILSNPVDLRIVAELLAQGVTPDLRDLHGQRYGRMATDYERRHQGDEFPEGEFAELAYEVLQRADRAFQLLDPDPNASHDQGLCIPTRLKDAVDSMHDFDMVTLFHDESGSKKWRFRHETVTEFFAVNKFVPKTRNDGTRRIWDEHIGDYRFNGVFLLLASRIRPCSDDMESLRRKLDKWAVEHHNRVLYDDFYCRLESSRESQLDAVVAETVG